ncbi:MAG: type II toxin-antitoxin system mRNA interferase toxin, RelE/StbE family [Methanothrix sp.]
MSYKIERTLDFKTQYRKLTKKDHTLQERLDKRFTQIIEDPYVGEPKRYNLKYTRGSHVDPFVIVYMIIKDTILFIYVGHHDIVYKEAPKILGNIEHEFPALWAIMSPDLKRHLKQ